MTTNGQNTCESCLYYEPESVIRGGQPGQGVCRRYPPSVNVVATTQGGMTLCNFPIVKKDAWCGEYCHVTSLITEQV